MIGETYVSGWRVAGSVIAGMALAIVPLPRWLEVMRPNFLLLIVIYWSLFAPRIAGLTFAWLCGLTFDVLRGGVLLGQHALMFLVAAAITHGIQLRLRIFPIWQQAAVVLVLLLTYEICIAVIDGFVGQPILSLTRWLQPFVSALMWPVVVSVLDTWNRRRR